MILRTTKPLKDKIWQSKYRIGGLTFFTYRLTNEEASDLEDLKKQ